MSKFKSSKNKGPVMKKGMILDESSPWALQEAYKRLRTNITFSLPGAGCKIIGVTSALASDGKSISAINVAISFAQIGKKVILIECDLRRPTLALKFGIKGIPGLTNVLVGQAKTAECIRNLAQYHMHVLPAGNIPPDPTWLLQSTQMTFLLEQFKKIYDIVVVDLPPITSVADATIMAGNVDGFLFVVRHNKTDVRAIASSLEQMKLANSRILGFVYNDADSDGNGYGSYRYKYSYKYKYSSSDAD